MTKLELVLSSSTFEVVSCDETTRLILDCSIGTHASDLFTDPSEWHNVQSAIHNITSSFSSSGDASFETLPAVFRAPGVQEHAPGADRSKLEGVFRSPMQAIHLAGELEIAALVYLTKPTPTPPTTTSNDDDEDDDNGTISLTAIEYSRAHRKKVLRQEFGSWLLEEHIEKAVIATTVMGDIVFWNRFASELYGYPADEVLGKSIMDVTPSDMTQAQGEEIMALLSQGDHWTGQFRVKKKDGSSFVAHVTDTPILGAHGTCEFMVGVSADYTQLYDLMQDLETLNANLERQVHIRTQELLEIQTKAQRAEFAAEKALALSQAKTDMMQMLSHELRSPLQGIMGTTSTMLADLRSDEQSSEAYDEIATILASSRLLLTLINNVLDIRKMEEHMMEPLVIGPVNCLDSIENGIGFCAPFANQHNVQLTLNYQRGANDLTLVAMGNGLRLEQVLINLITNSVKYGGPGKEVVISICNRPTEEVLQEVQAAAASDMKVMPRMANTNTNTNGNNPTNAASRIHSDQVTVLSVRDFGPGIPYHEFDRVFGYFHQLSNATNNNNNHHHRHPEESQDDTNGTLMAQSTGSGLGLNLVLKFVVAMGGHVWVDNCTSDTGGGAKFSVGLPRCDSRVAPLAKAPRRTLSSRSKTYKAHLIQQYRVLVVDDTIINCKVLSRMLHKLDCAQVWTAHSAQEGLDYLTTHHQADEDVLQLPNLIISDLRMPGMSGYEFIQQVHAMQLPTNPVGFAWSADWDPDTVHKCLESGFERVMRKPMTFGELKTILMEHVDGPPPREPDHGFLGIHDPAVPIARKLPPPSPQEQPQTQK